MILNQTHIISVSRKNIPSQKHINQFLPQDQKDRSLVLKISNFIQSKKISIQSFWNSQRNYASPEDINAFCLHIGLRLDSMDKINLKEYIFQQQQVVSIYDFCQQIPYWKQNCKEMVAKFMKEKSSKLILSKSLKPKYKLSDGLVKENPSSTKKYQRKNQQIKENRMYSNNSQKYLSMHRISQQKQRKILAQTIIQNKKQNQYLILSKVTQANDLSSKLNMNCTFKAFKNQENDIQIRIFSQESQSKLLKPQNLDKEIKFLKQKQKNTTNLLFRQIMMKSGASFGQSISDSPENSWSNNGIKSQSRQQQLKSLLVNTVSLTNLLKEQLEILKKKNVYGCENI